MRIVYDIDGQNNHENLKYCPRCGTLLGVRGLRGHPRPVCPNCSYILYLNPAPVTAVIIERDGAILLVRRRYPPGEGLWCLPTGFIEQEETPEESAVREVKEETGLQIEVDSLFDSWSSSEDPRTPIVCFAFTAHILGGTLAPGDDAADARFFMLAALPDDIAFASHHATLERYSQKLPRGDRRRSRRPPYDPDPNM